MSYIKFGTCHPFFLEIRRFCCSGTLNLIIIIIIHPSIHSSIVFMMISFYSQREANLLQTAADLVITDSVVWTTLRHVVALNRFCLFALWQGIWQQNPQKSMENLWLWFRGGGFLHQTRELRNMCVRVCVLCVGMCMSAFAACNVTLKIACIRLCGTSYYRHRKAYCIIGPLGWHWAKITLTDRHLRKQNLT